MQSKIQLQINEPCHENWNKMTSCEQGRFCASCEKMVVDFTSLNDEKLAAYFKNYTGNTCGRFINSQLNRELPAPFLPKQRSNKWAFAMLFSSILLCIKIKAQAKIVLTEQNIQHKSINLNESKTLFKISGKILDENGIGIPYASVVVKNENWGISTDSLGTFSLQIKSSTNFIQLAISSVGYLSNEVKVNFRESEKQRHIIVLKAEELQNEIVITGYGTTKGRISMGAVSSVQIISIDPLKAQNDVVSVDATIDKSFKIFPNPAKVGSTVKLQFIEPETYLVRLINANGQILSAPNISIYAKGEAFDFILPAALAAGQYFVNVISQNSGLQATDILIVSH